MALTTELTTEMTTAIMMMSRPPPSRNNVSISGSPIFFCPEISRLWHVANPYTSISYHTSDKNQEAKIRQKDEIRWITHSVLTARDLRCKVALPRRERNLRVLNSGISAKKSKVISANDRCIFCAQNSGNGPVFRKWRDLPVGRRMDRNEFE